MAHEHDREVIVSDGGSGFGVIVGVILVIALLAGIWFFALGPGSSSTSGTGQPDINVDVSVPTAQPASS